MEGKGWKKIKARKTCETPIEKHPNDVRKKRKNLLVYVAFIRNGMKKVN